jgi:hypothetical protein
MTETTIKAGIEITYHQTNQESQAEKCQAGKYQGNRPINSYKS